MNAARADVLHARLRGRGTAIDVVLQSVCAAIAPTLVGVLADAYSLQTAFLVLVPLMGVSGILLLLAVRPYIRESRRLREIVRAEALADEGVEPDAAPDDGPAGAGPDGEPPNRAAVTVQERAGAVIEHGHLVEATAAGGDLLTVDGLDLSYGPIQVLFDVQPARPRRWCARARRAQRRRQDDAAVRDRRARRRAAGPHPVRRHRPHGGSCPTNGSGSGSR